jgi:hypothetical protein
VNGELAPSIGRASRRRDWLFVGLMTLLMSLAVSAAETLWSGHRGDFLTAWGLSFARAYVVVLPAALLFAPVARRLSGLILSAPRQHDGRGARHPQLEALPEWPAQTIAVLATADGDALYAIPVSAPVRADDRRLLLSLHRIRGSVARLRARAEVAVVILAPGNVAFTARGRAHVVGESMACAPDYAAILVEVEHLDDHRQPAFVVESWMDRRWLDDDERQQLRARVDALQAWSPPAAGTRER